ncbi:MAG: IS630 transposase-related protein [Methanobacteriaceae archaeon]|nr:IS630 transposase-related protein [Methanobacteriaceae archaeon]
MKSESKMGRPTKLTQEIQDEIVEYLKTGNYVETACQLAGIATSTYYEWLKKADKSSRSPIRS